MNISWQTWTKFTVKYLCTIEVSRNRLIDWSVGHWSQPQCPSFFPEVQKLQTFILLTECWVFNVECWSSRVWLSNCILEIITWPMKESKFQEFQEAWPIKQEKDQTWIRQYQSKDNKGKGLETSVILYQTCSHRLPHRAVFLVFPEIALLCASTSFDYC